MFSLNDDIIDVWDKHVRMYPDNIIFQDKYIPGGLSFQTSDMLSGKVYGHLKTAGIGREDIVLICLPRGIKPLLAMVGVLKAGAAFLFAEEEDPAQRIAYMKSDCHVAYTIDSTVWKDIMNSPSLSGHEKSNANDAAFIVYTSGSSGNPKGVLHERGKFPLIVASFRNKEIMSPNPDDRFALVASFHFVASIIFVTCAIFCAFSLYVVDQDTLKNPYLLRNLFITEKINIAFLMPSVLKMFNGKLPLTLRLIISGGENANNIYVPGIQHIHVYSMSETAFSVTNYVVKKAEPHCPIGKTAIPIKIDIDSNGEFIFETPYTRGYISRSDLNAEKFKDGMFHSGDSAVQLDDGNYVINGRLDDMVKINGNRVEPTEVEAIFQKISGFPLCLAKGFQKSGNASIVLYYEAPDEPDIPDIRSRMCDELPEYMIPARFIRMDKLPTNSNGKLSRLLLPEPDSIIQKAETATAAYTKPRTQTEKRLYDAACKVLGVSDVDIYDDFYDLGGDSLTTVKFVMESGLYSLNANDVFRYRTIAKIAEKYDSSISKNTRRDFMIDTELEEREKIQPLTVEQRYIYNYQQYTPYSTMYVLPFFCRLSKDIDLDRLTAAIEELCSIHPVFHTRLFRDKNWHIMQRYSDDIPNPVVIKKISDTEFYEIKEKLYIPYDSLLDTPLYRFQIYETPTSAYMYFDIHHILCDGSGFRIIFQDLVKLYNGDSVEPDFYYFYLSQKSAEPMLTSYIQSKNYFKERYGHTDWTTHLPNDTETKENNCNSVTVPLDISLSDDYTPNVFFITAALLSLAYCSASPSVCVSWVYNGRDEMYKRSTVGLLFRMLPVSLRLTPDIPLHEIFEDVSEQVIQGISNETYPYVIETAPVVAGDYFCVLFQGEIKDLESYTKPLISEILPLSSNYSASQSLLDIEISDNNGEYMGFFEYNSSLYRAGTMDDYVSTYHKICHILKDADRYTASLKELYHKFRKSA